MGDGRTYANVVADPRRDQRGRHDRRLGQAAVRRARQDLAAGSSTRSRASTASSTTSRPSRRPPSSGSDGAPSVRGSPLTNGVFRTGPEGVEWRHAGRCDSRHPSPAPHCTWCSAELPSNHETICPSCGATLLGDGETQVPGLTAIDAEAILRNARAAKTKPRSRLMSWISGEYEDDDAARHLPARSRRRRPPSGARCSGSSWRPRSRTPRPRSRRWQPTRRSRTAPRSTCPVRWPRRKLPRRRRGRRRCPVEDEGAAAEATADEAPADTDETPPR